MRILDFIVQTLLLFAALFSLVFGREALIFIAFFQFFMGVWQLISATITTVNKNPEDILRTTLIRIFWSLVIVYFTGLTILGLYMNEKDVLYIWFFSAWMIAIYYYAITIKLAFGKPRERKTFLDIAN